MKKLYIIGNGFDRFHGIPSSYTDFRNFLYHAKDARVLKTSNSFNYIDTTNLTEEEKVRWSFADAMSKYIQSDELWSNFEYALSTLDYDELMEYASEHLVSYYSDDFRDRDNHSYQVVLEDELSFVRKIEKHLKEWVVYLEHKQISPQLRFNSDESHFITFNYTSTLENGYGIEDKCVTHIHGSLQSGELIYGHGISNVFSAHEYDDIRMTEGSQIIKSYFESSKKDTNIIIHQNGALWNSLCNITEIVVIGHSLSYVDLPYFKFIYNCTLNNDPVWRYSYYGKHEKINHANTLMKLGVKKSKLIPFVLRRSLVL